MKKIVIIAMLVVVAAGGIAAKTFLLKAKPVVMKVDGQVYVLPHQFTLNLADGRYATLTAALILAPGQSDGSTAESGSGSSDGDVGTLPEEAVIRDIITNVVTGVNAAQLTSPTGRSAIKKTIKTMIGKRTDVKVSAVLLPDVAVQ